MIKSVAMRCLAVVIVCGTICRAQGSPAEIKDAESATHVDAAATYQIVDTYEYPDLKIVQFTLPVLSHYSYLLVSGTEVLAVDPGRDINAYLEYVRKEGVTIKGVFLTHSHADFVAGHAELAHAVGCPIFASATSGAGYDHKPLKEGDEIAVGEAVVRVVETPGHTPDGLCGYVSNRQKMDLPVAVFTGDTLFVGSIGRPDLLEGTMTAASLASMAYDTWHNKLSKLADNVVIFPAHGAGSLCGAHLRDEPFSTIGAERATNPYLQHRGRSEFIAAVLEGLPEAPQYFKHNAAMNRDGPPLVDWNAPLPDETPVGPDLTDPAKCYVVDIRNAPEYAAGHIPNSVNIALRGRFESWVGRMVPWGVNLVLYGPHEDLMEATHRLHRVGYKAGILSTDTYAKSGLPFATARLVLPRDLYDQMQAGIAPIIVDVRLPEEWMGLRIGTVINMPLDHLAELSGKLDPRFPTMTVCNSAYRSSMGLGILERNGFKDLYNMAGGSEAWIAVGLPVYGAQTTASGTKTVAQQTERGARLPDRISTEELQRLLMDLPDSFDLIDIRPPQHFADYHLPASTNVEIAELLDNPAYLAGVKPLIIVDRDGSLAMMAAGILSQKTQRTVKALYGGLSVFWTESTLGATGAGVDAAPPVPPTAPTGPAPPAGPVQPVPSTQQQRDQRKPPTKKSAGC